MEVVKKILQSFFNVFRFHKKKIIFLVASVFVFLVLLFPFDDLSDFAAKKIADLTNNEVILQFSNMSFDMWPQVGIGLSEVNVDTPTLPTIKAGYISLAPSLLAFLSFKVGVDIKIREIFDGKINIGLKSLAKPETGGPLYAVNVGADDLNIQKVSSDFELPVTIMGTGALNAQVKYDRSLINQPEGDVTLELDNALLPPSTIPTPFGPMSLQGLKWSRVRIKSRIYNGALQIEEALLGENKDPFYGRIKGKVDLRFESRGGTVSPILSGYDLKLELNVDKSVNRDLALFLSFVDKYKASTMTGDRYLFQVSGSTGGLPNISALNSF